MNSPRFCSVLLLAAALPAQELLVTTQSNLLVRVHAATPGSPTSMQAITGLASGEKLLGIDFRPKTGALYGLGSTSRLYRIDLASAVATPVGPSFVPVLNGTSFGFDFNPTVDKVRIVGDADQNLRLDPDTGAVISVDGTLGYGPSDPNRTINPNVVAAAYTNSFAGATTTTLYGIDSNLDQLVTQAPPNNGQLNSVGKLGVNIAAVAGFDIAGTANLAFAAFTTQGGGVASSALFRIDLTSGAASFVGILGLAEPVTGLSILPTPGAELYGTPTPGCFGSPAIGSVGSPAIGNTAFGIFDVNAHPNTVGRLILGTRGLTVPFQLVDLSLWVDPMALDTLWLPVTTDGAGATLVPLAIPNDPGLAGFQLFAQFAWFDRCTQGGVAASNALAMKLF